MMGSHFRGNDQRREFTARCALALTPETLVKAVAATWRARTARLALAKRA